MDLLKNMRIIFESLREAGDNIRRIESGTYIINNKSDKSPITDADLISDSIIRNMLSDNFKDIPVLSEEQSNSQGSNDKPSLFWLLDPLDGTKEFIKGNGEYCISLALIEEGRPVEAYIYWPAQMILWYAIKGEGAYRVEDNKASKLPINNKETGSPLLLLQSRSHTKNEEVLWYEKASLIENIEIQQQGSAIKFCHIAEGRADFYIKKGRIYGWDIAAGDLILSESGGRLMSYGLGGDIIYSFDKSEMPHFIACSYRIDNPAEWLL